MSHLEPLGEDAFVLVHDPEDPVRPEPPAQNLCRTCQEAIRLVRPADRRSIDCWAHERTATLWCRRYRGVAMPERVEPERPTSYAPQRHREHRAT